MKRIELKEMQKIETDILKYIDDLCLKNNIKYTTVGGTLLGAIRHNGFIPWDDDVDIGLVGNDYHKLINILKKNKNSNYILLDYSTEPSYFFPFPKLVDKRTALKEHNINDINNYGIYVDIFQYIGVPNNYLHRLIYFFVLKKYQLYFSYLIHKEIPNNNGIKGIIKHFIKCRANHIGIDKIMKKYNKISSKYDINKTKYCTSIWPCVGWKNQILDSNLFFETKRHKFENIEVNIMQDYDNYLSTAYGDYMQLPPKEDRVSAHASEVIWRNNNE